MEAPPFLSSCFIFSSIPLVEGRDVRIDTERPDWLPQDLFPFESHYAEIQGATIKRCTAQHLFQLLVREVQESPPQVSGDHSPRRLSLASCWSSTNSSEWRTFVEYR